MNIITKGDKEIMLPWAINDCLLWEDIKHRYFTLDLIIYPRICKFYKKQGDKDDTKNYNIQWYRNNLDNCVKIDVDIEVQTMNSLSSDNVYNICSYKVSYRLSDGGGQEIYTFDDAFKCTMYLQGIMSLV